MPTSPDLETAAWLNADAYERYMGRWSRRVAPLFLNWLAVAPARRWLDVGCGTGALSAAILGCCAPTSLVATDPSAGFLHKAREQLGDRVRFECASDSDGGKMDLICLFWDTAIELDPKASALQERAHAALCRPEGLAALFMRCGLAEVDVHGIAIAMPFRSFDDFWQPFLGGQGPAPAYAMSLAEPAREHLRERLRSRLARSADGSAVLAARAWAVRGVVPK